MAAHSLSPVRCLGVDLAGIERRETGIALLLDGRLELLAAASTDADILAFAEQAGPGASIAINAPLTPPRGRCCVEDDCSCRHDPGTRSRQVERDLLRLRAPTLSAGLIHVLASRGIRLARSLRAHGWEPIEVYPFATLRLMDPPTAGKRTALGRRRIHAALQPLVPGLDHPDASEHQLDALVCAYTAHLRQNGLTRQVGAADEGIMVIPDAERLAALGRPPRRVAEGAATYDARGDDESALSRSKTPAAPMPPPTHMVTMP